MQRLLRLCLMACLTGGLVLFNLVGCSRLGAPHNPAPVERDITLQAQVFVDTSGRMGVDEVAALAPSELTALNHYQSFPLGGGALWMRLDAPPVDAAQRWYLLLDAAAFIDRADFYQASRNTNSMHSPRLCVGSTYPLKQ